MELTLEQIEAALQQRLSPERRKSRSGLCNVPWLVLPNNVYISMQASHNHYCQPTDDIGPWKTVEVMTNGNFPALDPYLVDCVYARVPIRMVAQIVLDAGGCA